MKNDFFTLQVKLIELCETSFFSAIFLPVEVWLLPVCFSATNKNNEKRLKIDALERMAANMNKHETVSGVISFDEMNFSKSATENNSTNNLTFSEDEEEEANIYDLQGNIL